MKTHSQIVAQQRQLLSFLPHVRAQFGNLPGVEIVGLGAKERRGKIFDEWAFRFYVSIKRPLKDIPKDQQIPKHIFGIQTDVISHFEKLSLVCETSVLSVDTINYHDDGIRGGISIRNQHFDNDQPSGYGTLGILARRKSDNALVGLTCSHVVNAAAESATALNTKIGHPKYWISCCCCPHGYIGDVAKATSTNDLDCAIIDIHDDLLENITSKGTENLVEGIVGNISGAAAIICFEAVRKRGRATGLTTGKVSDISYGTNQMLIERTDGNAGDPFACHGDSGAVIVNSGNKVVGLLVAADRADMKKVIATHIKPVMADLGISIAGTDVTTIGEPVGGGPAGCELHAWPGGQADSALNPVEEFKSTDFQLAGLVDWDVSSGRPGAVIVETGTQTASQLDKISVRYDTVSPSKNPTDAVWIKAKNGNNERTKFRTIFQFIARTVNTSSLLESSSNLRFAATGGTDNTQCGVAVPGTNGAAWFLAKAETVYDIGPQDLGWSGSGGISFVTGAALGIEGNIIARREVKFTRGEQASGAANRTHIDQATFISAGDSTPDDFQGPTDAAPNELFRLANEGFDPTNLLQGYLRADYRDYLEFHNNAAWIRITPYGEWHANLTATLSGTGTAPPTAGAPNSIDVGASTEKVPNQQPTITVGPTQEVRLGQTGVQLTAVPADADNDVLTPTAWTQTAGTPVALTGNPGNAPTFTAPGTSGSLVFSATTRDNTEGLSRAPGNNESAPATVTINVVEWLARIGGYPNVADNETEIFRSVDFGFDGLVDWDVSTGGTSAFIIETGGTTAIGTDTITVRYDNASADETVATSVIIQATDPAANIFFKRRTVVAVEWAAWPGGQADTALNPFEEFASAAFGFAGDVTWNIATRGTTARIISLDGVAGVFGPNAVGTTIRVRYDDISPGIPVRSSVIIQARKGTVTREKARTVFSITPQIANTSNNLHGLGTAGGAAGRNDLRHSAAEGTTTQCGVVDPTMAGVTNIAAKMEQVYTILPLSIPWTRRLTSFVFDDGGSVPQMANSKFELRARRDRQAVFLNGPVPGNRNFTVISQDGTVANDAAMVNDGFADSGDCQYPTNAMPNHIFRTDAPGIGPLVTTRQFTLRSNFREYIAWHNGTPAGAAGWSRITPYSEWFANLTMALPTAANPHPNMVAPNTSGAGAGAGLINNTTPTINGGVDQSVARGIPVTLTATYSDAENDPISGTFTWTQTSGTTAIPGGTFVGNPLIFVAPGTVGRLTFSVHADDNVANAASYNPGNSRGTDTVNVDVT